MKTKQTIFLGLSLLVATFPGVGQPLPVEPGTVKGKPGFFRVGRTTAEAGGQWWFLTPEGEPFFYRGVCAVNRAGTQGGRRATPGPYARTVDSLYDYPKSPDAFVRASLEKLRRYGFNALGAWTTAEFFDRGMPYTEIIEFFREGPHLPRVGRGLPLPDVFDPAWVRAADQKAQALCAPRRNSRDLVGYFTDNEIGFGDANDDVFNPGFVNAGVGQSLLRKVLAFDTVRAITRSAREQLWRRYGSWSALSAGWGVPVASWEQVRERCRQPDPLPGPGYAADARAFVSAYAGQYFRVARDAIRRHDPNHLILGCRFGGPPDSLIAEAIRPYTDVLSANNYQPALSERYEALTRQTGLPLLIGEFSWNTDLFKQVPLPDEPAEAPLAVRERMFRRGQQTLRRLARNPALVGYTWYRWVQPASTAERFTDGLIDYADRPNLHADTLATVNRQLDALRRGRSPLTGALRAGNLTRATATLWLRDLRPGWSHQLNALVRDGRWYPTVTGYQMRGRLTGNAPTDPTQTLALAVAFEAQTGRAASAAGEGRYTLRLNRDGTRLRGTFEGVYEGKPVRGRADGWLFDDE